jgi:hypothetical protein
VSVSYVVEAHYPDALSLAPDGWVECCSGTRPFCEGYLAAHREVMLPRPAMRLRRLDKNVVVDEIPASDQARVGMVAGWPTPEQLLRAAVNALRPLVGRTHGGRSPTDEQRQAAERALSALVRGGGS